MPGFAADGYIELTDRSLALQEPSDASGSPGIFGGGSIEQF